MKKIHQKELLDSSREANDKYNQLNKKKLDLEDHIAEQDKRILKMQKEMDDLIRKIEEEKKRSQNSSDKNIDELVHHNIYMLA